MRWQDCNLKRGLDFIFIIGHVVITTPDHRNDKPGSVGIEFKIIVDDEDRLCWLIRDKSPLFLSLTQKMSH